MSRLKYTAEMFSKAAAEHEYKFWTERNYKGKGMYMFIAEMAQAIYDKHLEGLPKVFSGPEKYLGRASEEWSIAEYEGVDTHTARLDAIEEIK